MFNALFGIGRAYKKLPPHHNFTELAANVEALSNYLLNRGAGDFATEGYRNAAKRWEWQLGNDLRLLLGYARDFVPPDTNGLHHYSGRGKRAGS